jgi:hypothetical protein
MAQQDPCDEERVVAEVPWAMRHALCGIFEFPAVLALRDWSRLTGRHDSHAGGGAVVAVRDHARSHQTVDQDGALTPTDNSRSCS